MPALVLRSDRQGHLYAAYEDGDKLVYHVSNDGGRTWTGQKNATAPGVRAAIWNFDVGPAGHVAFTYLGNRRSGSAWRAQRDGFVAESYDGMAPKPRFWTAMLNRPGQPLMYGAALAGATNASERFDWTKSSIGPDGTAWAALWQDCGPTPNDEQCLRWQHQTRGLVGRLYWPRRS
jgi:hypothetical protein